jgi:hypothetical protein
MKFSSPDATLPLTLAVNGTYVKVYKAREALHIIWAVNTTAASGGGGDDTTFTITNVNGSTTTISLPTLFSQGSTVYETVILPISCLAATLIRSAGSGA